MNATKGLALLLAAALAAGACSSGDDEAAGHDHDHSHGSGVSGAGRCDAGLNTAAFNRTTKLVAAPHAHEHGKPVAFTMRQWAEVFVDERLSGLTVDGVAKTLDGDPSRSQDLRAGEQTHLLGPDAWVPTRDAARCATLTRQLQQARDAAERYPTVAAATAAGYTPGSFYAPGGGAHYVNMDFIRDGRFDPSRPDLLMFDGHAPTDHIVGVMYWMYAPDGVPDGKDAGFVGRSDMWHSHAKVCRNAAGLTVPRMECDAGRGKLEDASFGYMVHAWVVPGCESDWGVFSEANPRLPILLGRDAGLDGAPAGTPRTPFDQGCNSGKPVTAPVALAALR